MNRWLVPEWPAPPTVRAVATTRAGGVSQGAYAGLNLGDQVGDLAVAVAENRRSLAATLPSAPIWLEQVHGVEVVAAHSVAGGRADGAWTDRPGVVCVVQTADCLPVLLCDRDGTRVAALHGGWRGLAAGILERGIATLGVSPDALLAWLGPAIGPQRYEVDATVRDTLVAHQAGCASAFAVTRPGYWSLDLYTAARILLRAAGVRSIQGGGLCTASDPDRFYSYRRDGITGRMATLIWVAQR